MIESMKDELGNEGFLIYKFAKFSGHTTIKFRYFEKATKIWLIFHFLFDIT